MFKLTGRDPFGLTLPTAVLSTRSNRHIAIRRGNRGTLSRSAIDETLGNWLTLKGDFHCSNCGLKTRRCFYASVSGGSRRIFRAQFLIGNALVPIDTCLCTSWLDRRSRRCCGREFVELYNKLCFWRAAEKRRRGRRRQGSSAAAAQGHLVFFD